MKILIFILFSISLCFGQIMLDPDRTSFWDGGAPSGCTSEDIDTDYTKAGAQASAVTLYDDSLGYASVSRTTDAYVYKSHVEHSATFTYCFDFIIHSSDDGGDYVRLNLFGVATDSGTTDQIQGANDNLATVSYRHHWGDGQEIYLLDVYDGDDSYSASAITVSNSTTYYATFKDTLGGSYGMLKLYIYSDANRTTNINGSPITLNLGETVTYDVTQPWSSEDGGSGGSVTGRVENVKICDCTQ